MVDIQEPEPTTVQFPLSPEDQLMQLGEQLGYLEEHIESAETEGELLAYAELEDSYKQRMAELYSELGYAASHHESNKDSESSADERITETFGRPVEKLSGVSSIKFIGKDEKAATAINGSDLEPVMLHPPEGSLPVDALEVTTNEGAKFRIVDASPLLSARAREPFAPAEEAADLKQDAMRDLLQDLVSFADGGYVSSLHTITARPSIKYTSKGNTRAYYTIASKVKSEVGAEADAPEQVRTFLYIGSCQKNRQEALYRALFGLDMRIRGY